MRKLSVKKFILAIMFGFFLMLITYIYVLSNEEEKNIIIDKYNFKEFYKAKPILESVPLNAKKFYTLKEFNEQYKADIRPIKNCFDVSNENGKENFRFGFKLYSKFYRKEYLKEYFVYPSYDLPYDRICTGYCYDGNMDGFLGTISNPCKE